MPLIAVLNTLLGFQLKIGLVRADSTVSSTVCARYTAGSIFFEKNYIKKVPLFRFLLIYCIGNGNSRNMVILKKGSAFSFFDGLLYWEREFRYTVIREDDEHEKQTPAPNA